MNVLQHSRDYNPWPESIYHFPDTFQDLEMLRYRAPSTLMNGYRRPHHSSLTMFFPFE
jgi:hypothetical protein